MVRFFSSLCKIHGKSRGVLLAYRKCFILHGGTESDKRKTNLYTGKMQLAVIPTSVKQVDLCSAKKLEQNLDETINNLTATKGTTGSHFSKAVQVAASVPGETELMNFYTELNLQD